MKLAAILHGSAIRHTVLSTVAARWAVTSLLGIVFAGSTILTPLYVVYQQTWGFSQITLTLVYAAYVIGNLAALLMFGRLSDQIGRKRTIWPVLAIAACGTVVFFYASNAVWLGLGRALSGLAVSLGSATCTAWLAELYDERERPRAAAIATIGNFLGLAFGALLAGVLSQYAPWPLHLTYVVYMLLLAAIYLWIHHAPETVRQPAALQDILLRPRISVPKDIRLRFIPPACAACGAFALIGFYAALVPTVLRQQLHVTNHAVGGIIIVELCLAAALAALVTRTTNSRTVMKAGLLLLIPSVLLLVWAQAAESMPILLLGTALSGVSAALGYRGSLQVVNQLAPPDQRAAVLSAYMVVAFTSNSIPVIGIGVLSMLASPVTATLVFAATISVCSLLALAISTQYSRQ